VRLDDVAEALHKAEGAGLEVMGLHVHIGSSIENPGDYEQALERIAALARITGPRPVFNMGGGFGLHFDLGPLAKLAWQAAAAFGAKELWLEPGRWLVATAGVMLTRVLEVKQTGRTFAVCDAGMSELIRPMLYGARHLVKNLSAQGTGPSWDLAGPACESGDVLARELTIAVPKPGDLLAVLDAGAYGASMFSNYLTRPRPAEALLENGIWHPLRRRDTLQEMLAAEVSVQD
jgi:diaminopimelate decarboxylase